jgi:hypothetical protein
MHTRRKRQISHQQRQRVKARRPTLEEIATALLMFIAKDSAGHAENFRQAEEATAQFHRELSNAVGPSTQWLFEQLRDLTKTQVEDGVPVYPELIIAKQDLDRAWTSFTAGKAAIKEAMTLFFEITNALVEARRKMAIDATIKKKKND